MTSSVKGAPAAQLIAVLGAGGVGKTTTAAALALGLAERGLRVAVITVDPARRLAQALGLESLSNSPREVTSFANGGKLSALWLDARGAFEDLVRKYSSQPESAERILNNRLFKILQSQLGGIEEYLGVEKVLSLGRSGDFDVCVLDTPPSRHALDFLESPRHLIRFFDESVLRVFVKEDGAEEKSGFFSKILRSGRQQAIEIFKNFLGKSFLAELGELLTNLKPVHKIFTETAEAIEEWVRLPRTRFVGVSLLEPYPLDEIRLLGLELSARELPELQMVVLNKCLPDAAPPPIDELTRALGPDSAHGLTAHFEAQHRLRTKMREARISSLASAEILRYSGSELNREHLLAMGRTIIASWESKDPGLFLRP